MQDGFEFLREVLSCLHVRRSVVHEPPYYQNVNVTEKIYL